jgi:uncharacterized membrane protein YcaP (DUF421 family)
MEALWNSLTLILGLGTEPKSLTLLQICLRGIVVFMTTLVMLRLGDRRALAQKTAFDTVLIVLLASMLARAINGSATFFATLGGGFFLVLLHRGLAQLCHRSHTIGRWVKGDVYCLVRDGDYQHDVMRQKSVSQHDIEEDMRLEAQLDDIKKIKTAHLERSGELSFIPRD